MKTTPSLAAAVILSLGVGCSLPSTKLKRREDAVKAIEAKIDDANARKTEKAAVLAHAVSKALANTNSAAIELAKKFNERTVLTLGSPKYLSAIEMDGLLEGLLSTNPVTQAASVRALTQFDSSIGFLDNRIEILDTAKTKAEERKDKTAENIAESADTWIKIKRVILFGLGGMALFILIPVGIKIAGLFLGFPAIGGIADSLFGGAAKALFRVIPTAASKAGVVATEAYDKLHATTTDLVSVVEKVKKSNPSTFEEVLKPLLKAETDDTTREVIKQIRPA